MSEQTLSWLAYGGALAGFVIYFLSWVRKPAAARLLNNAGLFLTSLGLVFIPLFMPRQMDAVDRYAVFCVLFLLLALAAQALAAVRERRAWDGLDRRENRAWDGVDRRGRSTEGRGDR